MYPCTHAQVKISEVYDLRAKSKKAAPQKGRWSSIHNSVKNILQLLVALFYDPELLPGLSSGLDRPHFEV